MAIYPQATLKLITAKSNVAMHNPKRANAHIDAVAANSLYPYFNRRGNPDSHFFVKKDGEVEQYRDTKYRANADLNGNPDTISIETASRGEAWNAAQIAALIKLYKWILNTHKSIPAKLASNSNPAGTSSHGISWHRLGVPHRGVYSIKRLTSAPAGWLQSPKHLWYSTAQGKTCPGDANIALMPTILAGVKGTTPAPAPKPTPVAPKPTPAPKPTKAWPYANLVVPKTVVHTAASHAAWTKLMTDTGYLRKGEKLTFGMQRWLKALGFYKGRIDGDFGGWTIEALQLFLRSKGLYKGLIDGKRVGYAARGSMTIRAEFAYLNSQRKYYTQ